MAYLEKEQRDLVRLDYADVLASPLTAGGDPPAPYASYFAELLDEWAPENDPTERLYRLGVAVLDAMCAGVAAEPLARYFEYWLLRLAGRVPVGRDVPAVRGARWVRARCSNPIALVPVSAVWIARPGPRGVGERRCASSASAARAGPGALGAVAVTSEALVQLRGGPSAAARVAASIASRERLETCCEQINP